MAASVGAESERWNVVLIVVYQRCIGHASASPESRKSLYFMSTNRRGLQL